MKLEKAIFEFTQDANCLQSEDEFEQIKITLQSDLGVDWSDPFITIKTKSWSIDDVSELKELIERCKLILKPNEK